MLDLGPLRVRGRGWAGEEEGKGEGIKREGGKGRAPKLLLNQGPSEPCYATDYLQNMRAQVDANWTALASTCFLRHFMLFSDDILRVCVCLSQILGPYCVNFQTFCYIFNSVCDPISG